MYKKNETKQMHPLFQWLIKEQWWKRMQIILKKQWWNMK